MGWLKVDTQRGGGKCNSTPHASTKSACGSLYRGAVYEPTNTHHHNRCETMVFF